MTPTRSIPWARLLAGLLATLVLSAVAVPRAAAAEAVDSYVVAGSIAEDGGLSVKATITFDGAAPATLVQRFATVMTAGDRQYTFDVSELTATSGGTPVNVQTSQDGDFKVVTLATQGLTNPVELSYLVKGAALKEETGETTVSWRLLQGLSLPVKQFTAELAIPSGIKLVDCQAGPPTTLGACGFYGGGTHDHPNPFFSDGPRGAGEVVNVVVRFPEGTVKSNESVRLLWTIGRAFSTGPLPLGLALGLLALGAAGLWLARRRLGGDQAATGSEPTRVAEFTPVGAGEAEFRVLDEIRPGLVGTVVDERVDPVDVTATLLDLAIRGHLRIEELGRESAHAPTEWTFTRLSGADKLASYEKTLLNAVAPAQGEPIKVSNLGPAVGAVIGQVQDELYDEVVRRGWFAHRPDQTRSSWSRVGWIALAAAVLVTVLLAAFTTFGLAGLALVILALGLLWIAQEMPSRTAQGVALMSGLDLLRAQLLGHPTNQMPKGREVSELSEILPYAVVLGGADRWLQAVADADDDAETDSHDLPWYHAHSEWHLADLPASLRNFVTTVQGTLFSR